MQATWPLLRYLLFLCYCYNCYYAIATIATMLLLQLLLCYCYNCYYAIAALQLLLCHCYYCCYFYATATIATMLLLKLLLCYCYNCYYATTTMSLQLILQKVTKFTLKLVDDLLKFKYSPERQIFTAWTVQSDPHFTMIKHSINPLKKRAQCNRFSHPKLLALSSSSPLEHFPPERGGGGGGFHGRRKKKRAHHTWTQKNRYKAEIYVLQGGHRIKISPKVFNKHRWLLQC